MFRALLKGDRKSLMGHLVLSEVAVAVPLFALGLAVNIGAGYPTADLGWLILLPALVGLPPGLFVWQYFTASRMRRNDDGRRKTGETRRN